MYMDQTLMFSDAQAPTGATGDIASTNAIDLGAARQIGIAGRALFLVILCSTTVTSGGSATVTFRLETDTTSAFGAAVALWTSAAIAKATLVAGYTVAVVPIPPSGVLEWLRVVYNVGVAALTAGKFKAFITDSPQLWTAYADALN